MIRVSAYPTVAWLTGRSFARAIVNDDNPASLTASITSRLRRWSDATTLVESDVWITTPDGEQSIDILVSRNGRRVGYQFSTGFERNVGQSDALTLVYGKLEALYRIRLEDSSVQAADLAYVVVSMNPSWFSADGRIRAGRVASSSAMQAAQGLKQHGSSCLAGTSIERRRITRPREWVSDFERALGLPDFRTYVSERLSVKQNRPSLKLQRRPVKRGSVKG
jgi:hypothetical protein